MWWWTGREAIWNYISAMVARMNIMASEPDHYSVSTFGQSDFPIEFEDSATGRQPANAERSLGELLAAKGAARRDARVEVQERFAFPGACLVFALLAVPLAARPRRGGRAMGFIVSLLLVCGYYLILVLGTGFARQGKLSPAAGIWAANFFTGLLRHRHSCREWNISAARRDFSMRFAAWSARIREWLFGNATPTASATNGNNGSNAPARLRLYPFGQTWHVSDIGGDFRRAWTYMS